MATSLVAEQVTLEERNVATHANPVWRDRANFIIMGRLQDRALESRFEQLWARQLTESTFEVCCIPFFIYDVDLGDHVETYVEPPRRYVIRRTIWKSGHFTFRVIVSERTGGAFRDEVISTLHQMECRLEWYSADLLAVDVASEDAAQQISSLLLKYADQGLVQYETGRTR